MTEQAVRVLVVDDEPNITSTLAMILNMQGFETASALSGVEAVALARTFRPHVALLDVHLGDITGIEVALAILETMPGCQIVLITGLLATHRILDQAKTDGLRFELLIKPVQPPHLLEILKQMAAA
ncbi:response regulator [Occallatibacter riparius]|uniref:Response regulator n=1 Tax=Occallatibacter riparius TaxID=1002689 RepID=A0A9J7BU54_9BACT|nr:response regulator [Occallatibacter riparius]UWZ86412.1 response regulator [Occallatibacter riparius]